MFCLVHFLAIAACSMGNSHNDWPSGLYLRASILGKCVNANNFQCDPGRELILFINTFFTVIKGRWYDSSYCAHANFLIPVYHDKIILIVVLLFMADEYSPRDHITRRLVSIEIPQFYLKLQAFAFLQNTTPAASSPPHSQSGPHQSRSCHSHITNLWDLPNSDVSRNAFPERTPQSFADPIFPQ